MNKIICTLSFLVSFSALAAPEKGDILSTKGDLFLKANEQKVLAKRDYNSKVPCTLYATNKSNEDISVPSGSRAEIQNATSYISRDYAVFASGRAYIDIKVENEEVYYSLSCSGYSDGLFAIKPSLSKALRLFSDKFERN